MPTSLYVVLALLFGVPAALLVLLAVTGRRGLRGAASSLKVELACVLLFVPCVLYSVVGLYLGLPTTHFVLAAGCVAILVLAMLVLRRAASKGK